MRNYKKGLEFSFAWIFAMIAGTGILFLAIFFAVKYTGTGSTYTDTLSAKRLSIIFEPFETGLASGKSGLVNLNEDTRIYNKCYSDNGFGKQKFSLATKQFKKWSKPSIEISISDKYVFSNESEEGKEAYFFSKPFNMPWKVSSLVFLTTEDYCFVDAPDFIKEEVSELGLKNIKVDNCSREIKVCFNRDSCPIKVSGNCDRCTNEYEYGIVSKNGRNMFYTGSLIYAAIFSSPDIYECNVKRLMKRALEQALVFREEADYLQGKCGVSGNFIQLANMAKNINNSAELILIRDIAEELEVQNEASECSFW